MEAEVHLHAFLTSAVGGCKRSTSHPERTYLQRKIPRYPLDSRLGGPQIRYGRCEGQNKFLPLPGIEPRQALNLIILCID
jgi:hypothetical protein